MEVFYHHIYEFKKGLRRMVLYTTQTEHLDHIKFKLDSQDISYYITYPGKKNINVFFGDSKCIEVIKSFNTENLNKLSLEEDFILGALLGYDLKLQCERYLTRVNDSKMVPA